MLKHLAGVETPVQVSKVKSDKLYQKTQQNTLENNNGKTTNSQLQVHPQSVDRLLQLWYSSLLRGDGGDVSEKCTIFEVEFRPIPDAAYFGKCLFLLFS